MVGSSTKKVAATKKPACGGRRASTERVEPQLGVWSLGRGRGIARGGQIQKARRWAGSESGCDGSPGDLCIGHRDALLEEHDFVTHIPCLCGVV